MKLYLDNCCFNRPYDNQSSLTIRMETEAKLGIQEKIKEGVFSLGWSYILDFENNANPFPDKMREIQKWRLLAYDVMTENPEILAKMKTFISVGLKPLDALHVACAAALECDYFLTVDKGILKKAGHISQVQIINPIDFIMQWEVQHEN